MQYLDFEKIGNGNLKLTLTDAGREELPELVEKYGQNDIAIMLDLMDHQLGNGWEVVPPNEIGALTGCELLVSDEVQHNEDGDIVQVGKVYWHPNYMVENPVDLLQAGGLILTGVS